ncbi:MAG: outer membrane protein assembly factor BamE [Rhodocyclales bacterium]|nr:outer membrane protein assembly factor BamE [Rhodocyclales bacterium]
MFKRLVAGLVSLAAALLSGCDAIYPDQFKPGISTATEVERRLGPPAAEYANADGSVTWEYNRQPQGAHTHMLTFGADRVLLRIEQVLTDENYARLANGMSKEQVQRILGKPGSTTTFPMKREEVWDWRVEGTPPTEEWHFYAHFSVDSGLLVNTTKMMLQRGG